MLGKNVHIDETLKALCEALELAEVSARDHIKHYYNNANEEFVTWILYGHINDSFRTASRERSIEQAFIRDLQAAIGCESLSYSSSNLEIQQVADGLIVDIVLHNRRQEGTTGGDFGVVIVHPTISHNGDYLEIKKGMSSGLLCQAKMKDKNGKWGKFTKKQKTVLPGNMDFLALVFYSYRDSERCELNPILWKLCQGLSMDVLKTCLENDEIDNSLTMPGIVTSLGRKEIGTDNQELIGRCVSPDKRQYFEIRIHWPHDENPTIPVKINIGQQEMIRETVSLTY
jgi:hypothetical protein